MANLRPIRRSQLITPFGVGALVDFRGDESLMTAGLDEWPCAANECPQEWLVKEERLQSRLGVSHFRLPPDYREPNRGVQHPQQYIPFVRFPRWHYCPRRGAMEKLPLFGGRQRCPCRPDLECYSLRRHPWLIPSRLIVICPKGHIEDFPFMEWIHKNGNWDNTHKLRLLAGRSSAGLAGMRVTCSCETTETLTGIFNFDINTGSALRKIGYNCSGCMPWIGIEGNRNMCGKFLRVVQRGASNVYFPLTVSSIYLPFWGENTDRKINNILEKHWDVLTSGLVDGKHIEKGRCGAVADMYKVNAEKLERAVQRKLDGFTLSGGTRIRSEEEFRRQEYEALQTNRRGDNTDLTIEMRDPETYGSDLAEFLNNVCLVRKLRETRVMVGFSRLLPAEDSASTDRLPISKDANLDWLPANVVHGEGIFFEFKLQKLRIWAEKPKVQERVSSLKEVYSQRRLERGLQEKKITAKYVLLHTIAHALIKQLSFDCGYGSASLRERIYCELDESDQPMQGILIYTASGDSEGTLGGLVRQGEPDQMRPIVKRAIYQARWCSSDPVCIESFGQGNDSANLAGCHSCVLLPETSCETGNRLLDRGLIVGAANDPDIGFFSQII